MEATFMWFSFALVCFGIGQCLHAIAGFYTRRKVEELRGGYRMLEAQIASLEATAIVNARRLRELESR